MVGNRARRRLMGKANDEDRNPILLSYAKTGSRLAEVEAGGVVRPRLCLRGYSRPQTARALSTSVVKSSRLEKTAVTPLARACFSVSASLSAVSKKIGILGAIALSS